ncbi:MAG: hypothetical protein JNM07_13290 [Phycisphaerae bacterium]|nr:hypothetical protein [Phycisphaerae bacterium]
MTWSHLCSRCGNDMARVAPCREPRHGLWVRFCPGCGTPGPAWERGRHPLHRLGASCVRTAWAVVALALRIALWTVLTVLVVQSGAVLHEDLRVHGLDALAVADAFVPPGPALSDRAAQWWTEGEPVALLRLACVCVLGGAALRATFPHVRFRVVLGVFLGLIAGTTIVALVLMQLDRAVAVRLDPGRFHPAVHDSYWTNPLVGPACMLMLAPVGAPLGAVAASAWRRVRIWRWGRTRRRLRTERNP